MTTNPTNTNSEPSVELIEMPDKLSSQRWDERLCIILRDLQTNTLKDYSFAANSDSGLAEELLPDTWHARLETAQSAINELVGRLVIGPDDISNIDNHNDDNEELDKVLIEFLYKLRGCKQVIAVNDGDNKCYVINAGWSVDAPTSISCVKR